MRAHCSHVVLCLAVRCPVQVPSMAANPLNAKKRIISKSFHRILDTYNRQTFTGEPASTEAPICMPCFSMQLVAVCIEECAGQT